MPRELIAREAALVAGAIYILQQTFAFAPAINEHSLQAQSTLFVVSQMLRVFAIGLKACEFVVANQLALST
jgi:hypothetical protein